MVEKMRSTEQRWMSLGVACRLLQVNEVTLRQWGDRGLVRTFRTPGGHRRFSREDILGITRQGEGPSPSTRNQKWEEITLKRIRRRLQNTNVSRQPWNQNISEEGKPRMRLFGRRLLSLVAQVTADRRRRQGLLAEGQLLGEEYGQEMAAREISLTDTVEAFIFFRNSLTEPGQGQMSKHVGVLIDQVLLGITRAYGKRIGVSSMHSEPIS